MISKGDKVKVLRKESYWYQDVGTVFKVEDNIKYTIAVRFTRQSYNGVNINNFNENELVVVG